jgi:hypothetical protein
VKKKASAAEISTPETTDSTARDEFAAIQRNAKSSHNQKKPSARRNLRLERSSLVTQISPTLRHRSEVNLRSVKNQSAEESSYDGFGTEHACAQMIFRLQRAPAAAADIGDILPSRPALRSVTNNVPIQDPEPCRIG